MAGPISRDCISEVLTRMVKRVARSPQDRKSSLTLQVSFQFLVFMQTHGWRETSLSYGTRISWKKKSFTAFKEREKDRKTVAWTVTNLEKSVTVKNSFSSYTSVRFPPVSLSCTHSHPISRHASKSLQSKVPLNL